MISGKNYEFFKDNPLKKLSNFLPTDFIVFFCSLTVSIIWVSQNHTFFSEKFFHRLVVHGYRINGGWSPELRWDAWLPIFFSLGYPCLQGRVWLGKGRWGNLISDFFFILKNLNFWTFAKLRLVEPMKNEKNGVSNEYFDFFAPCGLNFYRQTLFCIESSFLFNNAKINLFFGVQIFIKKE